jgi:hypothetical protein
MRALLVEMLGMLFVRSHVEQRRRSELMIPCLIPFDQSAVRDHEKERAVMRVRSSSCIAGIVDF